MGDIICTSQSNTTVNDNLKYKIIDLNRNRHYDIVGAQKKYTATSTTNLN